MRRTHGATELDELYKNSTIQNSVDMDKIDDLYLQVIGERASARLSELIKLDKTKQRVNE